MDLGFSESQEMLWRTARGFLEKQCPTSLVRRLEESEEGYSLELWQRIAELGWVGLIFPEEYGGDIFKIPYFISHGMTRPFWVIRKKNPFFGDDHQRSEPLQLGC